MNEVLFTEQNPAAEWEGLLDQLEALMGKRPADLNGVLFLIGVQELGQGYRNFTKEQKQDLMHIAICKVLSYSGFYELEGLDAEGWPHWKLVQKLPHVDLLNQEKLLKGYVVEYFRREVFSEEAGDEKQEIGEERRETGKERV